MGQIKIDQGKLNDSIGVLVNTLNASMLEKFDAIAQTLKKDEGNEMVQSNLEGGKKTQVQYNECRVKFGQFLKNLSAAVDLGDWLQKYESDSTQSRSVDAQVSNLDTSAIF
jgi:hypothetical protein